MSNRPYRWTVGVAALALVCAASAQTLSGVSTRPVGGGVEVAINGDNLGQPKALRVSGNRSYILEFDAKLEGKPSRQNVNRGGLRYVNVGWYKTKPPKVRVHMRMNPGDKPVLNQTDAGWVVALNVKDASVGQPSAMKVSKAFPDKVPPIQAQKAQAQFQANTAPAFNAAALNGPPSGRRL